MDYLTDPKAIEAKSFAIIDSYLPSHLAGGEKKIVQRIVHTTGDPDYAQLVLFSPTAVGEGLAALSRGATVITDVNMVRAGINNRLLSSLGGEARCLISDPAVASLAAERKWTRAMAAMEMMSEQLEGSLVAIGNAPTALFHLLQLIETRGSRPALVVGTPVGFVGAEEAKAALAQREGVPFITVKGRKGGSAVAAAVVNSLLHQKKDSAP